MPTHRTVKLLSILWSLCLAGTAAAQVSVPSIFADHMVLQRGRKIPVWGWAMPGGNVQINFAGKEYKAPVEKHTGRWRIDMDPMEAGGPYDMRIWQIGTYHRINLTDVMVGDVWICSGQSNMQVGVSQEPLRDREDPAFASKSRIRILNVQQRTAASPQQDARVMAGGWLVVQPAKTNPAWWFSAVGYEFGERLHDALDIPIGLIGAYWGATNAEAWTSRETLESDPELKSLMDPVLESLRTKGPAWIPDSKRTPTSLYNAMIHPMTPYGVRGVVWYQGESNDNYPILYARLFPAMISNWRAAFENPDLAFAFVQLPRFRAASDKPVENGSWATLRESQAAALKLPNTAMAVTIDLGDPENIHPKGKGEVARRLALLALHDFYGKDVACRGPIYAGAKVEGNAIRVELTSAAGLTLASGDAPLGFVIAGPDKKWQPAQAQIDGQTVIVSSPQVPNPVAVRYAWKYNPEVNLINADKFPAAPFRSDDWEER